MTQTAPSELVGVSAHRRLPPIDIGDALGLLARAVSERGEARCIVGRALSLGNVSVEDLEAMRGRRLRDLYREGRLRAVLTLGALIVLDAAQQSQDRGRPRGDVLDDATAAAARFLDLVAVLPGVTQPLRRCDMDGCILSGFEPSPLQGWSHP
jgi:hypothetical protein